MKIILLKTEFQSKNSKDKLSKYYRLTQKSTLAIARATKKLFVFFFVLVSSFHLLASDWYNPEEVKKACNNNELELAFKLVQPNGTKGIELQAKALGISFEEHKRHFLENLCAYSTAENPWKFAKEKWKEEAPQNDREYLLSSKYNSKIYNWVECKSNWNDECDSKIEILAPDHWQICNKSYGIASERGHNKYKFKPILWYEGDVNNPDRFRGYKLYLESAGSKNPLNREGANIKLKDIYVSFIPARATNDIRYELGCEMPINERESSPTDSIPDAPTSPFPNSQVVDDSR